MAANPLNPKKRLMSKSFHRVLDTYNRQMFTGPPENVRDHVMAGTKALMRGDWSKSYQYLQSLTVWNLVPQKANVLAMLKTRVQVGLRAGVLCWAVGGLADCCEANFLVMLKLVCVEEARCQEVAMMWTAYMQRFTQEASAQMTLILNPVCLFFCPVAVGGAAHVSVHLQLPIQQPQPRPAMPDV